MSVFKCKMCGGSLEVAAGETIIECEYCGTQQTLPKTTDENIQALFNRANLLRQKNDFDKAEAVYEKILEADDTEAEAYWGVILCKFGIEYVEDPKTYKRIPTCHRTSYDSIVADEYYKKAIENADITQRAIYEAEAKKIDEIQKGILAISAQEEPYDVFICYKETDESGKRTQDSVIANDIYYQLTQEGFKVFYAAITLEDKLGSAYEPIIFAALNSSKVMLSIGTKPEYFNAVWVKNEWSRFLKMMKNDRYKMLIPCYKGMDAYELPEEFAHLQAQDMGKIGFINDVVRGIKKVIVKDEPKQNTVIKETVVTSTTNTTVVPLLKRAFMFLEDGEFAKADDFCEQVLNLDPENAEAYLGKLMAGLLVKKKENLKDQAEPFDNGFYYQKAIRFADNDLKNELSGYISHIKTRNENACLNKIYIQAKSNMSVADTEDAYKEAGNLFTTIIKYQDSSALAQECFKLGEQCRKNDIYDDAMIEVAMATVASFIKAIELFKTISGWKDADEQIAKCEAKLPELREKEEKERIERERKAEQERIEAERRTKRNKKIAIIFASVMAIFITTIIIISSISNSNKYNEIIELKDSQNYVEAYNLCKELRDYKDCDEIFSRLESIILKDARELYLAGDASAAVELLNKCSIKDPRYQYVVNGDYKQAVNAGLKNIVIPNGVTSIGDYAFSECDLTSIVIPNSVTSIGDYAFSRCNLTSIVIPNSVTSIGDYAFSGCDLTSIVIPDSVTSIGNGVFAYCDFTRVTIPDSVTSIGNEAFLNCFNLISIMIPDSVTSIGDKAFHKCPRLESVTIGNGVTSIGKEAFAYCDSLANVTINSVTTMGEGAFRECKTLTNVTTGTGVTSIGYIAFIHCDSLTNVVISDSVTSIGKEAFAYCDNLKRVTIGNGVTSIGEKAFYECEEITTINYRGTESQWDNISKGEHWNQYWGKGYGYYAEYTYHTIVYAMTYNYTGD